jgi:hypothetical protein
MAGPFWVGFAPEWRGNVNQRLLHTRRLDFHRFAPMLALTAGVAAMGSFRYLCRPRISI